MGSPRVAFATGAAAIAGAGVVLAGRADGSALLVASFLVVARAAALAASPDDGVARRPLGRAAAVAPVWAVIAIVAGLRAGSTQLADLRGANAVLGLAVSHGSIAVVAAAWLAGLAGILALTGSGARGSTYAGWIVAAPPAARIDAAAQAGQAILLVTMFAGPQIVDAGDVIPWTAGAVVLALAAVLVRRFTRWDRADAVAWIAAAAALALALIGAPA